MDQLEIVNLYDNKKKSDIEDFNKNINSNLRVVANCDKATNNFEWLDIMEDTIRYIDNILRNPNRFIVNEDDIVKIELARRVTVESIKHLSKNTNLIQDIDPETGDVKPSKILNINKEESFNTYENRLIYSLIKNMQFYINRKKKALGDVEGNSKDDKTFEYKATSKRGKENIDISLSINSKLDTKSNSGSKDGLDINARIKKLENQITDLTCSSVYQSIDKLHISLVTSPIKKTNVILKNVNFQYAVKLWNYMQEHYDNEVGREKNNQDYQDNGELKKMMDESFMLDYLVLDSLNKTEEDIEERKEEISSKVVENMVEKVLTIDDTIDLNKLKELVGEHYSIIKYKTVVNEKQIEKIYKTHFSKYLNQINEMKI